ncbi:MULTISPECIES: hypothetical protein [Paenibacillus]|uniref:hypothetical protein n=1 Tax=Paenibacillus TaxID=44249 RepID=UPI00117CB20F|nr:hypothetical protein [Paenibacillus borealis]
MKAWWEENEVQLEKQQQYETELIAFCKTQKEQDVLKVDFLRPLDNLLRKKSENRTGQGIIPIWSGYFFHPLCAFSADCGQAKATRLNDQGTYKRRY